jgi:hypothetical protein
MRRKSEGRTSRRKKRRGEKAKGDMINWEHKKNKRNQANSETRASVRRFQYLIEFAKWYTIHLIAKCELIPHIRKTIY